MIMRERPHREIRSDYERYRADKSDPGADREQTKGNVTTEEHRANGTLRKKALERRGNCSSAWRIATRYSYS